MISPEVLRRYPFFSCVDDARQKAVAMVSEDMTFAKGKVIFEEGQDAKAMYILVDGSVSLGIAAEGKQGTPANWLFVGEINPGEPFGISSLLPGEKYTSGGVALTSARVIKIDSVELRSLMDADCELGFCLMQQMGKAALERLRLTHIQLAAAQN